MSKWETAGHSDEWYTPKYIFDALSCRFDVDVASPKNREFCNVPATDFITANSLESNWSGYVWMNPPFGGRNAIAVWLDKMSVHGNGIALTPDRTSAPWWQSAVKKSHGVLFIAGKVKFIKPDGSTGDSPSTGTCLIAYGYSALKALRQAEVNGLGMLFVTK